MKRLFYKILLALIMLNPLYSYAANLHLNGLGQLTGASGIEIGSLSYNVTFVDDSCLNLFGGCDELSDFLFTTVGAASSASEALLSQVLFDGVQGNFDTKPNLIFGCTNSIFNECLLYTFYEPVIFSNGVPGVNAMVAYNDSRIYYGGPSHVYGPATADFDFTNFSSNVIAVWSIAEVPIPATAWLFGSALAGLLGIKLKKS